MLLFTPAILLSLSGLVAAFCGMRDLTDDDHAISRQLQANIANLPDTRALSVDPIEVYAHIVRNSDNDAIYTRDIQTQIDVLNRVFANTAFSFTLVETTSFVYRTYGQLWPGSYYEDQIKQYRNGTVNTLNVYFVPSIIDGTLGYATFPWDYTANPQRDGIVMARNGVPGGTGEFTSGKILGHEVGHWLGLWHTFQGGCIGDGDYVDDTPAEAGPEGGCPVGRDSCPQQLGRDAVHNHMSYSYDPCRTGFTSGQITRMEQAWRDYRTPSSTTTE